MKRVLSREEERKLVNQIVSLLAESNCTLENYQAINNQVIKFYRENAILPILMQRPQEQ